jgi:hypothetical protein
MLPVYQVPRIFTGKVVHKFENVAKSAQNAAVLGGHVAAPNFRDADTTSLPFVEFTLDFARLTSAGIL